MSSNFTFKSVTLLVLSMLIILSGCTVVIPTAEYPTKPINLMVGYREGGGADRQARVIAKIMEEELGQPVKVSNIVGAGGTVAAQELLTAAPDGYNLYFAVSTALTYNPVLQELDYEVGDFDIPAILSTFQTAIVTYDEAPYNTWAEFVAWAKENPGAKYLFFGAESRLAMEIVATAEGLDLEYIPAGGGADMIPAVQGKEVDIAFSGGIHARFLDVEEGKMKVLMSTLPQGQTLQATPDVPNMHDLGYNFETAFQGIIVAPAGLPDDVFQKLAEVAEVAANHPAYAEVMADLQYPITFVKGEAARSLITTQRAAFEAAQAGSPPYFYTSHGAHENLGMIDLDTGAGTHIGPYQHPDLEIARAAWFVPDGAVYQDHFYTILAKRLPADSKPAEAEARLARVDMQTGELTLLGDPINLNLVGLEINACGEVFATGFSLTNAIGAVYGDTNLYQVDPQDASLTLIGDTGLERIMDLAFDPDGTLWATVGNVLYTLDLETGASTEMAQITGVEADNEIMGIAFTDEGTLFGTSPWTDGFYTIDPLSGVATEIGRHGFEMVHGGDIPMTSDAVGCN